MSKVSLYEPAMCCDTGVCGPGRYGIASSFPIIQTLEKADGVEVERFNLTGNPAAFVENEKLESCYSLKEPTYYQLFY